VPDISTGPRHQQSNFTVGPDHAAYGSQLFSNATGSLSWFRRVIEMLIGVRADFDGLLIDPRPPSEWTEYEAHRIFRGRRVRIRFRRTGSGRRITMRGKGYSGIIPVSDLSAEAENLVEVEY
jgi:cellobiose phosphorylase